MSCENVPLILSTGKFVANTHLWQTAGRDNNEEVKWAKQLDTLGKGVRSSLVLASYAQNSPLRHVSYTNMKIRHT